MTEKTAPKHNEVTVLRDDANAYCRILTLLGMEEEGDPVAEVASLLADIEANAGLRAKVAQQAALVEKCMAAMNENADRGEKAEARLAALEGQPHCATLHDDGYWTWNGTPPHKSSYAGWRMNVFAAAGAAPAPEDWRSAVAMAYGHLWHINNEPMAPIPLRSEESASYAARKLLRDLLTTEERGEAINSVRATLTASPKEPT